LEKQRKIEGAAFVSTVLSSDRDEVLHDRVPLSEIKNLTEEDYSVGGCTALLDAIGGAVHHIGNVHKYAREEDRPEKTIFVITTDGEENSSSEYSYDRIKQMISRQTEKYGWEFIFLGANMDAIGEAGKLGIRAENAARYINDGAGTVTNFECVSLAVGEVRCGRKVSKAWKEGIETYEKEHR